MSEPLNIPGHSTPCEDYAKELKQVNTFEDLMRLKEKYLLILDDAEEVINRITPENFGEFFEGLPKAMDVTQTEVDVVWAKKYGAIVIPRLFLQLMQYAVSRMGTGVAMHALVAVNKAEVKNGRFRIIG